MPRRRLLAPSVLLISAIAFAPRAATLTAAQWPSAAKAAAPEYGPPNGALVIAGGSSVGLPIDILRKFIGFGGGADGKFVIVPTAGGNFDGTGDDQTVDHLQHEDTQSRDRNGAPTKRGRECAGG